MRVVSNLWRSLSGLRSPLRHDPTAPLYPALEDVSAVSRLVALAVAYVAAAEGVAPALSSDELERRLSAAMWQPVYRPYRRAAATTGG